MVQADIDTGCGEATEEDPGLYINVNWDDDDDDGWTNNGDPPDAAYTGDKDDPEVPGGDNDFRLFSVDTAPHLAVGSVRVTFGGSVRVWETNTKVFPGSGSSEVSSGTEFPAAMLPKMLFVEGISGSGAFRDVEMKAEYVYEGSTVHTDKAKLTVFEVTLAGLFSGGKSLDNEARFYMPDPANPALPPLWAASNEIKGIISWDDANGDGSGAVDEVHCQYFHNCMEDQGTVHPMGVTAEVSFTFTRRIWGENWKKWTADSPWFRLKPFPLSWADDTNSSHDDQDLTPSSENHIYLIDGPGWTTKSPALTYAWAHAYDFRDWVNVSIDGITYQCSGFLKWYSEAAIKVSSDPSSMTRDRDRPQLLGAGWITVPENFP